LKRGEREKRSSEKRYALVEERGHAMQASYLVFASSHSSMWQKEGRGMEKEGYTEENDGE